MAFGAGFVGQGLSPANRFFHSSYFTGAAPFPARRVFGRLQSRDRKEAFAGGPLPGSVTPREPILKQHCHFPLVLSCWLYQNEIKRRQGVLPLEWHWRLKQSGRFLFPISATNPTLGRQKCRLPC